MKIVVGPKSAIDVSGRGGTELVSDFLCSRYGYMIHYVEDLDIESLATRKKRNVGHCLCRHATCDPFRLDIQNSIVLIETENKYSPNIGLYLHFSVHN